MNQKLLSKVLATMLAVILTFANFIMLGVYATKSYATNDTLENQTIVSNNENVEFDAYFVNGIGNKTHTLKQDIDMVQKLYLLVNVKKGYLKNAKIEMVGENQTKANFKIINSEQNLEMIENIDVENNIISLKQLNSGTQIVLEIPIANTKIDMFDLSDFSKINNIKLTGAYQANDGKTVNIEKTINARVEWEKDVEIEVEQETKAFIPYNIGEKSGTILQTVIQTGIVNNALPVKETKITLKAIEANGVKPKEVVVASKNNANFGKDNWNYNEETGIITITVENKENNNKIEWDKNLKDEFVITYIFNQKIETIETAQQAKVEIDAYSSVQIKKEKEDTLQISENEIKGNIVETNLETPEALSKGYLYTKPQKETEYFENVKVQVSYANMVDKIVVENKIDNFVNSKNEVNQATSYYKTTKVNKKDFEKVLGTDGFIKILGANGEELVVFTKESIVDENENFVYTYKNEINEVKIETSKPIEEGTIKISHVKSLNGKTNYTKAQIADFQKLQTATISKVEYENVKMQLAETSKDITLIAPSTKIEVETNKKDLSTVVKNENVEIKVLLKTNDITCDLYKNPSVEIVLPNYIEEVTIKDINLLFDNELKIKNHEIYKNNAGNTVIRVTIEGEQTTYNQNELSKGANLVINTDITLKKLTPTKEDVIKAYITNELVTTFEFTEPTKARAMANKGYTYTSLNAVAPIGVVTTNSLEGYNSKNETVTSISGEERIGKLETRTDAKTATVKMDVINNYSNPINSIVILGRIPAAGNTNTSTKEDLESNLTLTLNNKIVASGIDENKVTIYYSKNANANRDLTDKNNAWTTSYENLADVKSYLILLNDYQMNTGDTVQFSYNVQIPENLKHDMSTYAIYTVYFENIKAKERTLESVTATKVGLTSGQGPDLQVNTKANVESEVKEGEIIKYTVQVTNNGKLPVNNVTISANIPENTVYTYIDGTGTEDERLYNNKITTYVQKINSIQVGETKEITYEVEAGEIKQDVKELELLQKASVTVEGYEETFASNEIKTKLVQGNLKLNLNLVQIPETYPRQVGDEVTYKIDITNVNSISKKDVKITQELSDGVSFIGASQYGVYNKNTNTVTWDYNIIAGNVSKTLYVTVKVDELKDNTYQKTISSKITAKNADFEVASNTISFEVKKGIITVKQTTETPKEVTEGSNIVYHTTIENIGTGSVTGLKITNVMSNELEFVKAQYSLNGKTTNAGKTIALSGLGGKEKIELTVYLKAKNVPDGKEFVEVKNAVKIEQDGQPEILSNEIVNKVTKKASSVIDPVAPEKPVEGTHSITGIVWKDLNNNGSRDEEEQGMDNVKIILINAVNGEIVKDIVTGKNKEQQTVSGGRYTFNNLQSGKYMVAFLYDTEKYVVTEYQKEGINDDKNSDAILLDIEIEGKKQLVGVSDTLELKDKDINNIDLGLVENQKFDLKLDKVITKIQMQAKGETKEYNFKDAKFAKLDLNEKTIKDTSIVIEYKIRVTNEGKVAGYAKKIVDYIPDGMTFSSELNKDWYQSSNGNVYNSSLANTLINPGETKEVTLLLTKKMDENNLGLINNTAEIYESYNDLGIKDVDSTPANKVQNEDDISSADAMIGVKTGEVYVYILITIISMGILVVGIYYINKKVLQKI